MTISEAYQIAVQRHQAGRLQEAEALYRQILAVQPGHSDSLHLMGVIAQQAGRHELAVDWIRRAIAIEPNYPAAHCNLGEAFRAQGRLSEAITAYQQALRLKPDYAEAHNNLGNALRGIGRAEEAIASYRRAVELKPDFPEAQINLGNLFRDFGRFEEAIVSYRRALEFRPGTPEVCNDLGNALGAVGRRDEAIASYRHALELKPDFLEAHNNLGNALREAGQCEEAATACRRALELKPNFPEAENNLGNALRDLGLLDEAIASYRRAIELKANFPEAYINLGNALRDQSRLDDAVGCYRRAIELKPAYAEAHNNLGNAFRDLGQLDQAAASFRRAIQLRPGYPEPYNNLGETLRDQGQLDAAVAACSHAIELKPDFHEAHNNLGIALKEQGRMDEAVAEYGRAIDLKSDYSEAYNNLAVALAAKGDIEESISAFRQALQFNADHAALHGNLAYTLLFLPDGSAASFSEERRRWNRRFSEPLKPFIRPHGNDRGPERRLKVGYVSPDFRDHVIGRNLIPLFENYDRREFEIVCYSGVVRPDALTDRFRECAGQWRGTLGVGDEAFAEMIRRDGVDILVDLAQFLAGNRLPVFARQPAPVQVSFAGYPESTGLEAIGHRICDRYLESGTGEEGEGSEERVRLIDSFWCYDPCGIDVQPNELPANQNGRVTFGCLNNFCKVNAPTLKLWARVMRETGDSRLLLLCRVGEHRQRTLEFLEKEGIESQRVEFEDFCPRREYLELYHRVDIVLDTVPYNGHTTSLDALWMGVPVVSLALAGRVSRAGLSQLSNLGLPELVAHSETEYTHIAESLAGDQPRLERLRSTLRSRMEDSVLMDARHFTRQVEQAYREMWQAWCLA